MTRFFDLSLRVTPSSDHVPVAFYLAIAMPPCCPLCQIIRNLRSIDKSHFRTDVSSSTVDDFNFQLWSVRVRWPSASPLSGTAALSHPCCVTWGKRGGRRRGSGWPLVWRYHHHHHHDQSLNREGRWGTTDDLATSFLRFPCSPLPSGTCRTPRLSIPWCCLPTSSSVCLVFFPLSLCLASWDSIKYNTCSYRKEEHRKQLKVCGRHHTMPCGLQVLWRTWQMEWREEQGVS